MKRFIPLVITLSLLFSSCVSATQTPEPTTAPTETAVPSATATSTEIPLPSATATPTLLPDPFTYICEANVPAEDCDLDLVREGVRLGRYYLLNNFGSDFSEDITFYLVNDVYRNDVYSKGEHGFLLGQKPSTAINVAHPFWKDYGAKDFQYRRLQGVIHEITHGWEFEHGCLPPNVEYTSDFMLEGFAQYVALMATGHGSDIDANQALGEWQRSQWNQTFWLSSSIIGPLAIKKLIDEYGALSYTKWCDLAGRKGPLSAFKSVYGLDIQDFRVQFMDEVLGQAKDCTVAKCGSGSPEGQYSFNEFIDHTGTTPNLIVKFVDGKGAPVIISNIIVCKQQIDSNVCRQPDSAPGILSARLIPGRYALYFCSPGYPGVEYSLACNSHQTDWFDVSSEQTTNMTIQIPLDITNSNLSSPNLIVKFSDRDGNPVVDLRLEICNYDLPVKVCSAIYPGHKTDGNGIFRASLRSGKYLIRFGWTGGFLGKREWYPIYEIEDINVSETSVTSISYEFPSPNLIVKFTDALGSLIPYHEFVLCRVNSEPGNCSNPNNLWGKRNSTNEQGIFEAHVEPGAYFILTCKLSCFDPPFDYKVSNISVASDTDVTTVVYQLYK